MKTKNILRLADLYRAVERQNETIKSLEIQRRELANHSQKMREQIRKYVTMERDAKKLLDDYDTITHRLYNLIDALVETYNDGTGTKDRRAWMKDMITDLISIRGASDVEKENWKLVEP